VLAYRELPEQRTYELCVRDGRSFVIHYREGDGWELDAVYAEPPRRGPARTAAVLHAVAAILQLGLGALALLLRKLLKAMRRALKLRHRDDVVPA
jgi:hypothetical protein